MGLKHCCLTLLLFFSSFFYGQNEEEKEYSVIFEYTGPRYSNYIKIGIYADFLDENDSFIVKYKIRKEEFESKISIDEFRNIIEKIKKIPLLDILDKKEFYLDGNSVDLTLTKYITNSISVGMSDFSYEGDYIEMIEAIAEILKIIGLEPKDLK